MTENDLNIDLGKLQSESVNNGGTFRFLKLPIYRKGNLKEFLKNIDENVKFTSVYNEQTKNLIIESIDHWSLYSGCCPERNENSRDFNLKKIIFINNLFHFLNKKTIIAVYRVENLDSWLNEIIESGIDHINEDFIIQTNDGNYILHLGFSS